MMLQKIAGGGDFVKKQILRGDRNLSKLLRDESHREAVAFFFQKILLFSSCFEAVNSNPPPPRGACVAKLTPGQHKNQIPVVLKGVFIC